MIFKRTGVPFELLLLATITFFVVQIVYFVVFLDTWFDEANYTYKAWLAAKDMQYPFLDFRIKYPPIGFYTQVLFQDIFGHTLIGARMLSAVIFSAVAYLMYQIGSRLGNKWTGLMALAALTFHPYLMGHYIAAVPYALTIMFPLLALWVYEYTENLSKNKRLILAAILMTCTVLTRYNLLPILVVFLGYIWLREKSWKTMLRAICIAVMTFCIGLIPHLLIDAQYTFIWILHMFGPLMSVVPLDYYQLLHTGTEILQSSYGESYLKTIISLFTKFFYLWIILGTLCILAITTDKKKLAHFFTKKPTFIFVTISALILTAAHYSFFTGMMVTVHMLYIAPFLILSAVGAAHILWQHIDHTSWCALRKPVGIGIGLMLVCTSVSIAHTGGKVAFFTRFDKSDTDLVRIAHGGAYLRSLTTSDDIVFPFFDAPHLVAAAERTPIGPLINGDFTYVASDNIRLLERYRFYNMPMFLTYLEHEATVFIIQKGRLATETILTNTADTSSLKQFTNILNTHYKLVGSIENVYPRKYTIDNGTMEVYRRITPTTTPRTSTY